MYGIDTAHNVSSQVCLKIRSLPPNMEDQWLNFSQIFFVNGSCVSLELMIPCIFYYYCRFGEVIKLRAHFVGGEKEETWRGVE